MKDYAAVAVAPEVYEVVFENDSVRVLDVTGVLGGTSPMHSHPDSVMHALSSGKITVTSENGKSQTVEIPKGATFRNAATTHSVTNVGDETIRFIRIELK